MIFYKLHKFFTVVVITVTMYSLSTNKTEAATLLLKRDASTIFYYQLLFEPYQNLSFAFNQNQNTPKPGKVSSSSDQFCELSCQKDGQYFNYNNQQNNFTIVNNIQETYKNKITKKVSLGEYYFIVSHNQNNTVLQIIQSNNSNSIISSLSSIQTNIDLQNQVSWGDFQQNNFIENMLLATPEQKKIVPNRIPTNLNPNIPDEITIVANNYDIAQNSELYSNSTNYIAFTSFFIYGGIFTIILVQISLKTGISPRTILYLLIKFFQDSKKSKPKIKYRKILEPNQSNPKHKDNLKLVKEQELIIFKEITDKIKNNKIEPYEFNQAIQVLQRYLNYQNSLAKLRQYELTHRGFKQQVFYDFVYEASKEYTNCEDFQLGLEEKLNETLPKLKTDIGKNKLKEYTKELYELSAKNQGLRFIYLYKKDQRNQYSLFDAIQNIISQLQNINLADANNLNKMVELNNDDLGKVWELLELSPKYNNPENHKKILQYIGLFNKYQ